MEKAFEKKTAWLSCLLRPSTRRNLKYKADALGISVTQYIEKCADETTIFLDENAKALIKAGKEISAINIKAD